MEISKQNQGQEFGLSVKIADLSPQLVKGRLHPPQKNLQNTTYESRRTFKTKKTPKLHGFLVPRLRLWASYERR